MIRTGISPEALTAQAAEADDIAEQWPFSNITDDTRAALLIRKAIRADSAAGNIFAVLEPTGVTPEADEHSAHIDFTQVGSLPKNRLPGISVEVASDQTAGWSRLLGVHLSLNLELHPEQHKSSANRSGRILSIFGIEQPLGSLLLPDDKYSAYAKRKRGYVQGRVLDDAEARVSPQFYYSSIRLGQEEQGSVIMCEDLQVQRPDNTGPRILQTGETVRMRVMRLEQPMTSLFMSPRPGSVAYVLNNHHPEA